MKFTFILISFFITELTSSQSLRFFKDDFVLPGGLKEDSGDSDSRSLVLLINAVIPENNYFAGGQYLFEKWVKGVL